MLNKIKNYLPHKIEDELHYGNSKGSFNFLRQLSWNICHPYRLINRVRWINFLKTNNRRKIEFKKELETNKFQNFEKYSNELLEEKFNFYVDNGGVILDEFFSQELIDQFHHDYRLIIESMKKLNEHDEKLHVIYKKQVLNLTNNLIKLWLNDRLLLFMKKSLNEKVFAREYPILYYSKNNGFKITSKEVENLNLKSKVEAPTGWHIDHTPGLTNLHILLDDIDEDSTHMEFLPGSNRYFNMTDGYSDETVEKFHNKPIKCIGKRGTVYFHNSNTLHRVVSRSNKDRLSLIFSFSPGSGISIDSKNISIALSSNFDLEILESDKRKTLSALFPMRRFIEITDKKITDSKFGAK